MFYHTGDIRQLLDEFAVERVHRAAFKDDTRDVVFDVVRKMPVHADLHDERLEDPPWLRVEIPAFEPRNEQRSRKFCKPSAH